MQREAFSLTGRHFLLEPMSLLLAFCVLTLAAAQGESDAAAASGDEVSTPPAHGLGATDAEMEAVPPSMDIASESTDAPPKGDLPPAAGEDVEKNCAEWAANGQCMENAEWMQENCAASCVAYLRDGPVVDEEATCTPESIADGSCGAATEEAATIPAMEEHPGVKNKELRIDSNPQQCMAWATSGECVQNAMYMLTHCPTSCAPYMESVPYEPAECTDKAVAEGSCFPPMPAPAAQSEGIAADVVPARDPEDAPPGISKEVAPGLDESDSKSPENDEGEDEEDDGEDQEIARRAAMAAMDEETVKAVPAGTTNEDSDSAAQERLLSEVAKRESAERRATDAERRAAEAEADLERRVEEVERKARESVAAERDVADRDYKAREATLKADADRERQRVEAEAARQKAEKPFFERHLPFLANQDWKGAVKAIYSIVSALALWCSTMGSEVFGIGSRLVFAEPPLNAIVIIFGVFLAILVFFRSLSAGPAPQQASSPAASAAPRAAVAVAAPSAGSAESAAAVQQLRQEVYNLQQMLQQTVSESRHSQTENAQAMAKLSAELHAMQRERSCIDDEMLLSTKEILEWIGGNGVTAHSIGGITDGTLDGFANPPHCSAPVTVAAVNGNAPFASKDAAPVIAAAAATVQPAAPAVVAQTFVPSPPAGVSPVFAPTAARPETPPPAAVSPTLAPAAPPAQTAAAPSHRVPSPYMNALAPAISSPVPAATVPARAPSPAPQVAASTSAFPPSVPSTSPESASLAPTPSAFQGVLPPSAAVREPSPTPAPVPTPTPASLQEPTPEPQTDAVAEPTEATGVKLLAPPGGHPSGPPSAPTSSAPPSASPSPAPSPAAAMGGPPGGLFGGAPPSGGPPGGGPPAGGPPVAAPPAAAPPAGGPPGGGPPMGGRPPQQDIKAASNPFGARPKQQTIQAAANPFGARPAQQQIVAKASPFG